MCMLSQAFCACGSMASSQVVLDNGVKLPMLLMLLARSSARTGPGFLGQTAITHVSRLPSVQARGG